MKKNLLILFILLFSVRIFAQDEVAKNWLKNINLGKQEYAVENYASALKYFQTAAAIVPFDTLAFHYVVDCGYKARKPAAVFEALRKLQAINSDRLRHWELAIFSAREIERNLPHALELIQEARKKFGQQQSLEFEEIVNRFTKKEFQVAAQKLDSFLLKFPTNHKAYNLLYKIQGEITGNFDAALKTLARAQKAFPDSVSFKLQEADVYLRKASFDTAQAKFENLIKLNPKNPKLYYNLGLLHFEKKEYEQSAEVCKKAIELDPNYLDAIYNVGTFYYNYAITYSQALGDMTLEQYQEQGLEFERTAKKYFEMSKPFFEKAVKLNPNELDAYENINTIDVLLTNINANIAESEERLKADSLVKVTAAIDSVKLNEETKIDTLQADLTKKIVNVEPVKKDSVSNQAVANANTEVIKEKPGTLVEQKLKSTVFYGYGKTTVLSNKPYIELSGIRFFYPDTSATSLKRGQTAHIKFTVANRGETKAENLKAMLNQPYVTPDLKFPVHVKIDEINPGEVIHVTMPIYFKENTLESEAIEKVDLMIKKMRLYVKEPNGFNSELREFAFNLGNQQNANVTSTGLAVKNYLLLLAVDRYNNFDNTGGSVQRAENLKNLLLTKYKFAAEDVYQLSNNQVTVENIRSELIKIKQDLTPNDNLMIYFAGQSFTDTLTEKCYWLPAAAEKGNTQTYIDGKALVSYLKSLNLKHVCLFSDAAFSDEFLVPETAADFQPDNDQLRSRWMLAGDKMNKTTQPGVITGYLQQALEGNNNPKIAISEINNFVRLIAKDKANLPVVGGQLAVPGNDGGEFIFYKK
jgi:tetratricopeptide (TPR) repeat protein